MILRATLMVLGRALHFAIVLAGVCGILAACAMPAGATTPYAFPGPPTLPVAAPGLPDPSTVPGKEYSHDFDHSALAPGGLPDAKQVVHWDGIGGTADGIDYSAPIPPYDTPDQLEIDALANHADALFRPLFRDRSHLLYSVDDRAHTTASFGLLPIAVPPAGLLPTPDTIKGGMNMIGGAGELSYELAGAFAPANTHGLWAKQGEINNMPLPRDIDGVEVWGPEAGAVPLNGDASPFGDADRYSVDLDIFTGSVGPAYSVWRYDPGTLPGHFGYVPHSLVVDLVGSLLAPAGGTDFEPDDINIDALMVHDVDGVDEEFTPGNMIIFSIRQMLSPNAPDGTGFFATGSELFYLDGASAPGAPVGGFLRHGGHPWDKAYALANMTAVLTDGLGNQVRAQLDLNALEAVSVPEPLSATLAIAGLACVSLFRRRRNP